jgi:hypothetical protein
MLPSHRPNSPQRDPIRRNWLCFGQSGSFDPRSSAGQIGFVFATGKSRVFSHNPFSELHLAFSRSAPDWLCFARAPWLAPARSRELALFRTAACPAPSNLPPPARSPIGFVSHNSGHQAFRRVGCAHHPSGKANWGVVQNRVTVLTGRSHAAANVNYCGESFYGSHGSGCESYECYPGSRDVEPCPNWLCSALSPMLPSRVSRRFAG